MNKNVLFFIEKLQKSPSAGGIVPRLPSSGGWRRRLQTPPHWKFLATPLIFLNIILF